MNNLSDSEKHTILKLHKQGYNTVEIGKILNRDNSTVGRYLRKCNLVTHKNKCKLLEQDKQNIIELYQQGLTAKQNLPYFSDKVKSENTIMSIVKQVGINRPVGIVPHCDQNYFEKIDTEEKAYFLGLLLTDGNICKIKNRKSSYLIQIGLKYTDYEILEKLKKELNSTNKIQHYKTDKRDECYFGVSSYKLAMDLMQHGIKPNKTFNTELNYDIPIHLFRHYIRGIFDGDGTVYISKNERLRFGFYGTHKLVSQVRQWLIEQIDINHNKVFDKPTVSFVIYQRKQDVTNFYHLMYDNATIFLQRKKDKFDNYFLTHVNTEITK